MSGAVLTGITLTTTHQSKGCAHLARGLLTTIVGPERVRDNGVVVSRAASLDDSATVFTSPGPWA